MNEIYETEIERIVPGGLGLCHVDGRTIFVSQAATGDRVRIQIDRQRGRIGFGSIVDVLAPSPDRMAPPCPVYGECGGCDMQHLTYEAQLAVKFDILRDCLRRIGGIEPPDEVTIVPSPSPWHYRSRADWRYDPGQPAIGYRERQSHRVVNVPTCPILVPNLDRTLAALQERCASEALPAMLPAISATAGDRQVAIAPRSLLGAPAAGEVTVTVAGEMYCFGPECFFQVNHAILPAMLSDVLRHSPTLVESKDEDLALDLYCGVGLFTVPLARRFGRVIGVESFPSSVRYARRNLQSAKVDRVTVVAADVQAWLAASGVNLGPVALVVLDPPRSGLTPGVVSSLAALRPTRMVYVSCDPATLARDLRAILAVPGFHLREVTAYDMFPQTHHVETVAHLAYDTD